MRRRLRRRRRRPRGGVERGLGGARVHVPIAGSERWRRLRHVQAHAVAAFLEPLQVEHALHVRQCDAVEGRRLVGAQRVRDAVAPVARGHAAQLLEHVADARRRREERPPEAPRGDLDRAWSLAERTHAFTGAASAPDSIGAFATADRAQAGLYYVALTDRLLVWVARGSDRRARAVEVSARALRHDVARLRRAIAAGRQDDIDSLASSLWSMLVAPVRDEIGDAETLFIVAGGPFEGLPFAVLRDTDTGRYLVEDHAIVMLPNWRFLGGAPAAVRLDRNWDVFAAGDPAQADRRLPRLVGGRAEVLAIARRFPRGQVVIGREATPAAVLAAAAHATLIHVAAHLSPNEEDPGLSRLHLAPDAENPTGELFVRDLVTRPPTQLALVVLASCRSGAGRSFAAGLSLTAATPLLEAGVPAVVAALWDADDAGTAEVLDMFYAEASRGRTIARALAEAQRLAVHRAVPPRIWAALVLTGRTT